MALWVENIPHLQKLQIPFELGCEVSPRQVEPVRPSRCLLLLDSYAISDGLDEVGDDILV